MGNIEILQRGDLQLTSAGTGISHSEKAHGSTSYKSGLSLPPPTSNLNTSLVTSPMKRKLTNGLGLSHPSVLMAFSLRGKAPVQSLLTLYATLLGQNKSLNKPFIGKKGYIRVVQTSGYNEGPSKGANINITSEGGEELILGEGDGAYIFVGNSLEVENVGDRVAEVLVFDLD